MEATDKQKFFLKTKGIDATNMTKEVASQLISSMKENSQSTVVNTPQTEYVSKPNYQANTYKKQYNSTSYYVSYAKDLFCAMVGLEQYKNVAPEIIMKNAVMCIQQAKQELQG